MFYIFYFKLLKSESELDFLAQINQWLRSNFLSTAPLLYVFCSVCFCVCVRTCVCVCVCSCVASVCPLCPCIVPHIVFLHKKSWPDKVLRAVKIMPCLYVFISPWQFNYFWPHWRKPHKKLPMFIQILIRNAGKLKQSCFEMLSFFQGLVLELCLNQHKRK